MGHSSFFHQFWDAALPEPIKQSIREFPKILERLGAYEWIRVQKSKYKKTDFYRASEIVVNGKKTKCKIQGNENYDEFIPSDDNDSNITFNIIHNGKKYALNDDSLWILHNSRTRRLKLLRDHREWFDCPDDLFETIVNEISNIDNPQERLNALQKWQNSTAAFFYNSIYQKLHEKKVVDLNNIFPLKPECILYHFLGRYPEKNPSSFLNNYIKSIETCLKKCGFHKAFLLSSYLPIQLPEYIITEFKRMDQKNREDTIKSLCDILPSPILRIHIIHLVLSIKDEDLIKYASNNISYLLSSEGHDEIEAFLTLLRWVMENTEFWHKIQEWDTIDRLVVAWGHTNQLSRILTLVGAPSKWILDTFSKFPIQISSSLFKNDLMRYDIANPTNLSNESFLIPCLAYSVEPNNILSNEEKEIIFKNAFEPIGSSSNQLFWKLGLLRDPGKFLNSLCSFLNADRGEIIGIINGSQEKATSLSPELKKNVIKAIQDLDIHPESLISWIQIAAIIGDLPPYSEIHEELKRIFAKVNLSTLIEKDEILIGPIILLISNCILHIKNPQISDHIKKEILSCLKRVDYQKYFKENEQQTSYNFNFILKSIINLSINEKSIEESIKSFTIVLEQIQDIFPDVIKSINNLATRMCEELPANYSQHFWGIITRNRSNSLYGRNLRTVIQ